MQIYIRIEKPNTILNSIIELRSNLENEINLKLKIGNYGGESIEDNFQIIIRIFELEAYSLFPSFYKPVAKKSRKVKVALITQDIPLEELEGKDPIYIYNRFLDCVIASVRKLPEIKVRDVKIDELINALDSLRK